MVLRRQLLLAAAAGAGAILAGPHIAFATVPSDRRFVFIIQRGAADGLDILRPVGDPAYSSLRGHLAEAGSPGLKLDGLFTLHPALTEVGRMYAAGQALFVHAVASPYRDRSHFDGQNVLETGGDKPYGVSDGWLNRLVGLMPRSTDTAIAIAPTMPAALRGPRAASSYAPSSLPGASDDLMNRMAALYDNDPQLHALWATALETEELASGAATRRDADGLGRLAASFLGKANGPRIAMLETFGWDMHSAQAPRMATQLAALDRLLAGLRDGLGPTWAQTTVLIATEFGRTAGLNGTGGTDHGTGSLVMLVGGAVKGGRVLADWPGLGASSLYQTRDLKPTAALDALIAGAAAEGLRLDPARVGKVLFGPTLVDQPTLGLIVT